MLYWEKAGHLCLHKITMCPNARLCRLARLPVPAFANGDINAEFQIAIWAPDSSMVLLVLGTGDWAAEVMAAVAPMQDSCHPHQPRSNTHRHCMRGHNCIQQQLLASSWQASTAISGAHKHCQPTSGTLHYRCSGQRWCIAAAMLAVYNPDRLGHLWAGHHARVPAWRGANSEP